MRIGSFKLLNVWDRGKNYHRIVPRGMGPTEFIEFQDEDLYLHSSLNVLHQYLQTHRQAGDPDPIEILVKMFPKRKAHITEWCLQVCAKTILGDNDEPATDRSRRY